MLSKTLTVLLAGGVGSRLHPLTADRAKPAVPYGGKYRIIDFTLSNCLHSGLRRILVLTQYKSHSLQKHLRDGWSIFNPELHEYVLILSGDHIYRMDYAGMLESHRERAADCTIACMKVPLAECVVHASYARLCDGTQLILSDPSERPIPRAFWGDRE